MKSIYTYSDLSLSMKRLRYSPRTVSVYSAPFYTTYTVSIFSVRFGVCCFIPFIPYRTISYHIQFRFVPFRFSGVARGRRRPQPFSRWCRSIPPLSTETSNIWSRTSFRTLGCTSRAAVLKVMHVLPRHMVALQAENFSFICYHFTEKMDFLWVVVVWFSCHFSSFFFSP